MSPGGRPDPERVRNQAQNIYAYAGQTATWMHYISSNANAPRYGIAESFNYTYQTFTGLFYARKLTQGTLETQRVGGQVYEAAQYVAAPFPIQARDQIIWRGSAYRVEGVPHPESVGGNVQYHVQITLANATG